MAPPQATAKRPSLRGPQLAAAARSARRHSLVSALETAAAAAVRLRAGRSMTVAADVAADLTCAAGGGGVTPGQLMARMSIAAEHAADRITKEAETRANWALVHTTGS